MKRFTRLNHLARSVARTLRGGTNTTPRQPSREELANQAADARRLEGVDAAAWKWATGQWRRRAESLAAELTELRRQRDQRDEEIEAQLTHVRKQRSEAEAELTRVTTDRDQAQNAVDDLDAAFEFFAAVVEGRVGNTTSVMSDGDFCPRTGEKDCGMCSGEYCYFHADRPCQCDVLERHGLGEEDLAE